MMSAENLTIGLVSAVVASLGLWWFRLLLPVVRKQPKPTRFSVYALVWLAYFILTMMVIGRNNA